MRVVQNAEEKQSELRCLVQRIYRLLALTSTVDRSAPASFSISTRSPLANARHWHELTLVDRHELT